MIKTIFSQKRFRWCGLTAVTIALVVGASLTSAWIGAAYADNSATTTIRPALGKPLMAAQKLIAEKKYKDALAKLREAKATPHLTPSENALIDRFLGAAAAGAGDYALAARSFEAVIAAGHLQSREQLALTQAVGELLYSAKDYPHAVVWLKRYVADGGGSAKTDALLSQAYYLEGNYAEASKALLHEINGAERGGKPSIQQLELLATCQSRLKDEAGYVTTMEELVVLAPKPEYWADLIQRISSRPDFPRRLEIDVGRLRLATDTLGGANSFIELAEEALQRGFPGIAVAVLDKGFAKGVLGQGQGSGRQKRLAAKAQQNAATDLKYLPSEVAVAAARPDGTALINVGLDYLGYCQADKAASLIEQGIHKGHLDHSGDAWLDLGIAQVAAGHRDLAIQTLNKVKTGTGAAGLARLWIAYIQSSSDPKAI